MSGFFGDLSPKQETALAEFKENVKDVTKPVYDDYFFLRWLRARNFDVKKSETMLRTHLRWRDQHDIDRIMEEWQPPEVMAKYYTGGLYGQDRDGALVWVDPNGHLDMKGILMSMSKKDVIKSKVWMCERIHKQFREKTAEQGRRVDQLTIIFDLENFGLKHLWKPGADVFCDIITVFEEHYPETLKKTYVINAPKIFPLAYNLLKPFLSEETHKKVVLLGTNYKEVLLQNIAPDQLPIHWGGTCTDPDGDTRCSSSIIPGGEVPKSYYRQNDLSDLAGFTEASIGRGSSLKLEYPIDKPNCAIRWQFKTEGFDIGFGVFKKTSDKSQHAGQMDTVLASERVNSHMVPEDGMVTCKEAASYVVRFDNTYSWTRSKKLWYLVEILQPQKYDFVKMDSDVDLAGGDVADGQIYKSF